jgi:hypothetical protein
VLFLTSAVLHAACHISWVGVEPTYLMCLGGACVCQQQVRVLACNERLYDKELFPSANITMSVYANRHGAAITASIIVHLPYREARDHGLQAVGLPSRLASFATLPAAAASDDPQLVAAASKYKNKLTWWQARSKFSQPAPASTSQTGMIHNTGHPLIWIHFCPLSIGNHGNRAACC